MSDRDVQQQLPNREQGLEGQVIGLTKTLKRTKAKIEALKEGDPLDEILLGIGNGIALFGCSNLAIEQSDKRAGIPPRSEHGLDATTAEPCDGLDGQCALDECHEGPCDHTVGEDTTESPEHHAAVERGDYSAALVLQREPEDPSKPCRWPIDGPCRMVDPSECATHGQARIQCPRCGSKCSLKRACLNDMTCGWSEERLPTLATVHNGGIPIRKVKSGERLSDYNQPLPLGPPTPPETVTTGELRDALDYAEQERQGRFVTSCPECSDKQIRCRKCQPSIEERVEADGAKPCPECRRIVCGHEILRLRAMLREALSWRGSEDGLQAQGDNDA